MLLRYIGCEANYGFYGILRPDSSIDIILLGWIMWDTKVMTISVYVYS